MGAPPSSGRAGQPERRAAPNSGSRGRAEARRAASAGLADLTDRQAEAVAALDRALEARLGELDRAFATRQTHLEGARLEAEGKLVELIERGISEFKRVARGEWRLVHEESASDLAELDGAFRQYQGELEEVASAQLVALRELIDRVHELERAAAGRIRALEEQMGERSGPSPRPSPGSQSPG